jgi:endonuclease-8
VYARGKALLIEYDNALTHYSHNQLFGEWDVARGSPAPDPRRSVRVVIGTATHTATLYSATEIELLPTRDVERHPYISRLGPDALEPSTTVKQVRDRLTDRRFHNRSLSSLLLDQHFVAGLGNYLRSDILFAARILPHLKPRDLDDAQRKALAKAILQVTRRAYRAKDYRFLVYGREGEPCYTCGTKIVRDDFGGRGLYHCPVCQGRGARKV